MGVKEEDEKAGRDADSMAVRVKMREIRDTRKRGRRRRRGTRWSDLMMMTLRRDQARHKFTEQREREREREINCIEIYRKCNICITYIQKKSNFVCDRIRHDHQ